MIAVCNSLFQTLANINTNIKSFILAFGRKYFFLLFSEKSQRVQTHYNSIFWWVLRYCNLPNKLHGNIERALIFIFFVGLI
jgi:hypothetical protein